MSFCKHCFEKQMEIDRLEDEVKRLKSLLRYKERTAREGVFGSSTPSSQKPFKPNATEDKHNKHGGAKAGHNGYGRKSIDKKEADRIIAVLANEVCSECGGRIKYRKGSRGRTVIDIEPIKLNRVYYDVHKGECEKCGRIYQGKVPGVMPKSLFGNQLITHIAVQHYIYGTTLGRIEAQLGVGIGSMVNILHNLGKIFKIIPDKLIQDYRQSIVKHADETGWRNDGDSGYGWLFCDSKNSIFRFRDTRSSKVPLEIFGDKTLPGILVVDRYNAYNKMPIKIQYCYAHLLRTLEDIEKEFPDETEVKLFVSELAPLLTNAMRLRSQSISDKEFYIQAKLIKKKIKSIIKSKARHPAIQQYQDIFRNNDSRMYHWCDNRLTPADNNMAERELRPTVIARKVSFGSQSIEGAKTREILMTVLHTLKKRTNKFSEVFKSALDTYSINPLSDMYSVLFSSL